MNNIVNSIGASLHEDIFIIKTNKSHDQVMQRVRIRNFWLGTELYVGMPGAIHDCGEQAIKEGFRAGPCLTEQDHYTVSRLSVHY